MYERPTNGEIIYRDETCDMLMNELFEQYIQVQSERIADRFRKAVTFAQTREYGTDTYAVISIEIRLSPPSDNDERVYVNGSLVKWSVESMTDIKDWEIDDFSVWTYPNEMLVKIELHKHLNQDE